MAAAHRIFLDHDVTPGRAGDLDPDAFAGGTPRHVLPAELAASDEWLTVVVTRIYQLAIDASPSPTGWRTGSPGSGPASASTASAPSCSAPPEFYDRVDGDDETLVRAFYALILDRRAEVG